MRPLQDIDRTTRAALIAAVCLVAVYFVNMGLPAVWNPNEAFYAEAPREMAARGDLLTPYFNYEPRFQKPPLMYWLVYAAQRAIGDNEAAPRMVSAVAAAAGVLITYLLSIRMLGRRRPALIAAALVAGALDYNTAARFGSPEMLITVLTIAATGAFYEAYSSEAPRLKRAWYAIAYGVAAFATLAKGPIGLLLPLLVMVVMIIADRRWRELRFIVSPMGIAVYALIALPWYLLMADTYGRDFTSVAFGENIGRFMERKSGTSSPLFYFGSVPASFLPGSFLMLGALAWAALNRSEAWRKLRFPILWAASVFVFFSLSHSKLPTYVYSLFTPLAVITASWADGALEGGSWRRAMSWLAALTCLVVLGGVIWLSYMLPGDGAAGTIGLAALALICGYALYGALKYRPAACISAVFAATVVLYLVFTVSVLPKIEAHREYRSLGAAIEAADPAITRELFACGIYQESFTYYADRRVVHVKRAELQERIDTREPTLALVDQKTYEAIDRPGMKVLWRGKLYRHSESQFIVYLEALKAGELDDFVLVGID